MNEIYQLLLNVHEIVKANNMFAQSFEKRLTALEQKLTITDIPEPNASGAAEVTE